MFKKQRLYKIVYDREDGLYWTGTDSRQCTIFMPARDKAEALTKFYEYMENKIRNVVEVTEVV